MDKRSQGSPASLRSRAKRRRGHSETAEVRTSASTAEVHTDSDASTSLDTAESATSRILPRSSTTLIDEVDCIASSNAKVKRRDGKLKPTGTSESTTTGDGRNAKATSSEPRCVVSLRTDPEHGYVLSKSMTNCQVVKLEQAWCMPKGTLSPRTPANCLNLTVELRVGFDQDHWILLSGPKTVSMMFNAYVSRHSHHEDIRTLYDGAHEFTYHVVPRSSLEEFAFIRSRPQAVSKYDIVSYPFTTLDPVRSHVPPHFAMVNTALKLRKYPDAFLTNAHLILQTHGEECTEADVRQMFEQIRDLHDIWMGRSSGRQDMQDDKPIPVGDEAHHETATRTPLHHDSSSRTTAHLVSSARLHAPTNPTRKVQSNADSDIAKWAAYFGVEPCSCEGPDVDEDLVLRSYREEYASPEMCDLDWSTYYPPWARGTAALRTRDFSSNDWAFYYTDTMLWRD